MDGVAAGLAADAADTVLEGAVLPSDSGAGLPFDLPSDAGAAGVFVAAGLVAAAGAAAVVVGGAGVAAVAGAGTGAFSG